MAIMSKRSHEWLRHRIAQEQQLLAEEKWIVDAMKKIKGFRNSLRIERLHLQTIKARVLAGNDKNHTFVPSSATATIPTDEQHLSAPSTPEPNPVPSTHSANLEALDALQNTLMNNMPVAGIDGEMCNTETLNLTVASDSLIARRIMEEYDLEEEDDEDGDDIQDCMIDINMFMNGGAE